MKRIFKKLISVLSIICVLASVVLPAGVVSFAAGATQTDPIVTEIDFSTGDAWTENIYKKADMSAENPYVVTFDYYLASAATVKFDSVAGNIGTQDGSSSPTLQTGHHTFKGIYAVTAGGNCLAPRLKCSDTSVKLYIWNYSVTLGGEAITRDEAPTAAMTTATATEVGKLSQQAWYAYMDDPLVTEIVFPADSDNVSHYAPAAPFYFGGADENNQYTISFDYYLPESTGGMNFYSVSQGMSNSAPKMDISAGKHHYEWTAYSSKDNGQFVPAIDSISGTEMYIWNWKVEINGTEIIGQTGGWNANTNGTIGGPLGSYAWAKYIDCPTVTEIAFSTGDAWTENIYKKSGVSAENPYVVTFDYFLESSATVKFDSVAGSIGTQAGSSNATLKRGHHTFTGIYAPSASQNCLAPRLKCSDTTAKLYIWNYSITLGGEAITRDEAPTAAMTTATVTAGEYLVDYAWYAYMDDPAVTVVTAPAALTEGNYKWTPAAENFYFGGNSAETPYTVTFDYYLPETVASISLDSVSGNMSTISGSRTMSAAKGHHKVEWTTWTSVNASETLKGQFVPVISLPVGSEMYIWNWSVKIGDTEVTPVNRNYNASSQATMTYGTPGDFLGKYAWAKYVDCPVVTEIVFPEDADGASNYAPAAPFYFGGTDENNQYTISFDYYLPETTGGIRFFSVSQGMSNSAPAMDRNAGFHHYEWTAYSSKDNGQFVPAIESVPGTELYIWNWKVEINGTEIAGQTGGWNANTSGTVGKFLVDYAWMNPDVDDEDEPEPEKTITSIEVATQPNKVVYEIGEVLDTAGLSVKVNYSDDSSETITEGFEISGFDSATAGQKTVNVGYESFSITFTVTVNEPAPTEPTVTEIDFSTGGNWCLGFYTGKEATAEVPYVMTFEYYLAPGSGTVGVESIGSHSSITAGSMAFKPGHHTIYAEWKTNNANKYHVPQLKCADTNTKLYIWNYSCTIGGSAGTNNGQISASWRSATKTEVGKLSEQAWASYMDDPVVTEITFPGDSGATNWSPKPAWYFGGDSEANAYTVSFDYYLPRAIGGARFYSVSGGATTISGGTIDLTAGIHHFEWVGYVAANNGQLVTAIEATAGDQMYIWNWSVKIGGNEVAPTDKSAEWNGNTNGTVGKLLSQYAWANGEVKEITSVAIATQPSKTEYEIGEELDTAGLSLKINYSDDSFDTITEGFEISGFDAVSAGEKTITVTYEGFTATFTVIVNAPVVLESIAIASLPTKTEYEIGESLNVAGLSLLLTYSDGSTATINDALSISGFDSETAGEKTVTVTYEGFTATFTVTVNEAAVETNMAGDVNGDDEINNKDLGLVQRYINGWDVSIDELAADVNDDGEINNKDLGLLQRYINGWDVTLK